MSVYAGRIAVLLVATLAIAGCQPKDTRPGLWLSGERAERTVEDWRFTQDVEEIFIETRTRYGLRHSTTIWCAELDGRLYVGSYDDEIKFWERNVSRNPQARLRIDGRLFEVTLGAIDTSDLSAKLDERYAAKYDMADVFGDDLPAWRYYSVALRGQ